MRSEKTSKGWFLEQEKLPFSPKGGMWHSGKTEQPQSGVVSKCIKALIVTINEVTLMIELLKDCKSRRMYVSCSIKVLPGSNELYEDGFGGCFDSITAIGFG